MPTRAVPPEETGAGIVRDLLAGAIPVNPQIQYVTHDEFAAKFSLLEAKIENAALRQKQWVLTGCLAILISFGGGYVSLVSKLDRLTQTLPLITEQLNTRWPWIQQQQQRDLIQDEVLKKLDRNYQPLPYQPPPP